MGNQVTGQPSPGRVERVLRALAARSPLSTSELIALTAEEAEAGAPAQRVRTWYSDTLRHCENWGRVTPAGWTGGRFPVLRWSITDEGRSWLAALDAAEAQARTRCEEAAQAEADRAARLAAARLAYGRGTPRADRVRAARKLRQEGLTLKEIGSVFGVSAQMIHQDLQQADSAGARGVTAPG